MPGLNNDPYRKITKRDAPAQNDHTRNPDNCVYSGMTKRLVLSDGEFCPTTNKGRKRDRSG